MSLWKIAWRSIQLRALSSTLTGASMALGVALVVCVLVIHGVLADAFGRAAQGYHLVVGKKGSELQLVLNTVYHLQNSLEPVPYNFYKEFINTPDHQGKYAPYVAVAIPYCLGDNYEGFRVVATVPELFEKLHYAGSQSYRFREGRNFETKNYFEAVIGDRVARETGLNVGDAFQPTHAVPGEEAHDHDAFTVVGILAPTGTPNDRALFINMEGFYLTSDHAKPVEELAADVHDHDHDDAEHPHEHADEDAAAPHEHAAEAAHDHDDAGHHADGHAGHSHAHAPLPESQREVTAILILASNDILANGLARAINEGDVAQAASPVRVISQFFSNIIDVVQKMLLVLTVLIVVVAAIGIMVAIYNSMSERRHEIAVMRSLGARRSTVLSIILLESVLLSVCGGLAGFVLGHSLIGLMSPIIVNMAGIPISAFQFHPYEFVLVPGLVILAIVAGFLPAMSAYNTDVGKALSETP